MTTRHEKLCEAVWQLWPDISTPRVFEACREVLQDATFTEMADAVEAVTQEHARKVDALKRRHAAHISRIEGDDYPL
jgi:hypothetical protein